MEVLADQSVTVTSSNDEIHILAKDRIVLQAGQSAVSPRIPVGYPEICDASRNRGLEQSFRTFHTLASVGYDPKTMQNTGEVDTVWTLVERVADSGGGIPGEGASTNAGERHRSNVPAGQPCPEAGWWFTPAKADARRYFRQGDVMPSLGSDYGDTFWQWSPDQSAPKL